MDLESFNCLAHGSLDVRVILTEIMPSPLHEAENVIVLKRHSYYTDCR